MKTKGPIDIVITSYYRSDFTKDCLLALKSYTTTPHRVILIDNGSDEYTTNRLQGFKDIGLIDILILLDKNYGLEPAKNLALGFVQSDWYVDTDNDILVPPTINGKDWLSRLMKVKLNFAAVAGRPQIFIGADEEAMFRRASAVLKRDFVGGSMRLMNTAKVREVGGWRSNPKDMTEANRGEERYICGQLRMKGYEVGYARDVKVFHLFGKDEWGYKKGVKHYHRDQWPIPTDKMYGSKEDWYGNHNYR